jgi:hypothetical protein
MKADPVCMYCGKTGALQRDHVVPRARGGPDTALNIVMACAQCNGSKGDRLASEWLGERCPAGVLLIEARVNAKLKAIYKPRGKDAAAAPLFAFSISEAGAVQYAGEVVSESDKTIRLHASNAFLLCAGMWQLCGELVDVPRERCRLFLDRDTMLEAMDRHEARG